MADVTTFACDLYAFPVPSEHVAAVVARMESEPHRTTVEAALYGAEAGEIVRLPLTACDALLDAYAAWERAQQANGETA